MAKYKVKLDGKEYDVTVADKGSAATVTVEGRSFEVESAISREPSPAAPAAAVAAPAPVSGPPAPAAPVAGGSGTIVAPIPGVVTKVLVEAGDSVTAGQIVLKLEAMKMENDIATPVDGTVKQVSVADGTEVKDGQVLIVVE
jgi:glutaconyl-CoA decarboxylase